MPVHLTIENETSLPDGGPLSYTISGKRGIDLGRDAYLDWSLPDPSKTVSGKHCEIRYRDGAYWLHDVSRNGTFLNRSSQRMQEPHRLRDGDRLEIGRYIVAVRLDGEDAQAAPSAPAAAASPTQFWGGVGEAAPPISPRDLRPARELRPVQADFRDWAIDVPTPVSGGSDHDAFAPAPPAPTERRDPAFEDLGWAQGPAAPAPAPEPYTPTPTPRRPAPSPEGASPWDAPSVAPSGPEVGWAAPPAQPAAAPQPPAPARAPEPEPFPPPLRSAPPVAEPAWADPGASPPSPPAPPSWQPPPAARPPAQPEPASASLPPENPPGNPWGKPSLSADRRAPAAEPASPAALASGPPSAGAPQPRPVGGDAAAADFVARFAKGAGISPDILGWRDPGDLAEEVGVLTRLATESVKQLLSGRAESKRAARTGSHTMIQALDNNPLKFAPTPEVKSLIKRIGETK